jgi:rhodanese-related sulfurtransferase
MESQIKYYQDKLAYEIDPADLYEAINTGEKVIVIDARSPLSFERECIPGAINIPHREMNNDTTKYLDKENFLYVVYCDGIGCNASTHGSLKMTKLGFMVKELIGGLEWWKRDGFPTEGINAEMPEIKHRPDAFVLPKLK